MINPGIRRFLQEALIEDIGSGDITTELIIPEKHQSIAHIIAKSDLVLAGLPFVRELFSLYDSTVKFNSLKHDGTELKSGETIAELGGNTRSILVCERTALNILQRLSGIATLTKRFVDAAKGKVRILDTRKTTPCMRYLEKYAVRIGGGHNHRMGLYDGILIKDNHIKAAGGIKKAISILKNKGPISPPAHHLIKIEVEVRNLDEVIEAIEAGADVIMLDNMDEETIKKAVRIIREKSPSVLIEASGNVTLENIRDISETGVDFISIGAITHSAQAVDITLKLIKTL